MRLTGGVCDMMGGVIDLTGVWAVREFGWVMVLAWVPLVLWGLVEGCVGGWRVLS